MQDHSSPPIDSGSQSQSPHIVMIADDVVDRGRLVRQEEPTYLQDGDPKGGLCLMSID